MSEKLRIICGLNGKNCPNPGCRYQGTGYGCLYSAIEVNKPDLSIKQSGKSQSPNKK